MSRRTRATYLRLPPRWVRRVVLAPLVVLAAFVWLPVAVWLAVAVAGVVAWALPGRARPFRLVFMVGLYLLWDAVALVWMFVLWIASGFGYALGRPVFQRAHYRLAALMLGQLFWAARWVLRLEIDVEGVVGTQGEGRPVLVMSRHAGPGDSFILVHQLLNRFGRHPVIVMKDTLQWDPALDVLLNRVPTHFVTPSRFRKAGAQGGTEAIAALASGLDAGDALLIFPEGGNMTVGRRARRIAALREAGRGALADRAEGMPHLMPPHPGGVLAAMEAAPEATVVMVGHTGLERMVTMGDVWRELPIDKRIILKSWPVPVAEVPTGRAEREVWLYDWWERIDAWIDAQQDVVSRRAGRVRHRT